MFKTAFINSFSYKIWIYAVISFSNSKTKAALDKLSYFASESKIGKRYDKFKLRRPHVGYSRYQAALDKISALISAIMNPLHEFFSKLMTGSVLVSAYFKLLDNKPENKLRVVGIFGFYFCLSSAFISVAVGLVRGIGPGWGARVIPVFLVGVIFFMLAVFSNRLQAILNNSFFIRLLTDLLK